MAGFDPTAVGSDWLLVMADIHFYKSPDGVIPDQTTLDPRIQAAVSATAGYAPDRIVIDGDLCSILCADMGANIDPVAGAAECAWAQVWVDWLETIAPVKIVLGNHDTPNASEAPYVGAFMEAHIDQFVAGYESAVLGGVRVCWVNCTSGGDFPPADLASWKADMGALTAGQEMVTFSHFPGMGDVTPALRIPYESAHASYPALTNKLWSVCGHAHVFNDECYSLESSNTTVLCWYIGCGQNPDSIVYASPDSTAPSIGAICLRGGAVVARMAIDCKDGYWYLWVDADRSSPTVIGERTANVGQTILAEYLEGEYVRNGTNGPTTASGSGWVDRGSWTGCAGNYVMKFTVPSAATGVFFLTDVNANFEMSSNGSSWTTVVPSSFGNQVLKGAIPVPLRTLSPLYLRLTTGCNYGGCGFY